MSTFTFRAGLAEVVVVVVAICAAYGVVELLRFALALPEPRVPVLLLIGGAVMATRFGAGGFIAKLLGSGRK
ncbi:MAG: hypothetical protein KBA31_06505 [Alphaproteobacteria bacterium]|nr:hypothetical protein [Alphaproteobacteria bacterium]